jgi:putative transposase
MNRTIILDSAYYHVFNKSIDNHIVFETDHFKDRFCAILAYYNQKKIPQRFSEYMKNPKSQPIPPLLHPSEQQLVKIIAFCIMPNHYHLLVKAPKLDELSAYIRTIEISSARYFNLLLKRKGPLWQSRYNHVKITTNAQLLHVSRYIHLNPTTALLVARPEDWPHSSYRDYVNLPSILHESWSEISIRAPKQYKAFVENRKEYQRKLRLIKNHLI